MASNFTRVAFTKRSKHIAPNHSNGIMHFFAARIQVSLFAWLLSSDLSRTHFHTQALARIYNLGLLSHNSWFKSIELELLQQIMEYKIWSWHRRQRKHARAAPNEMQSVCRVPTKPCVSCVPLICLFVRRRQRKIEGETIRKNHDWRCWCFGRDKLDSKKDLY